jgi:hypothetical protein
LCLFDTGNVANITDLEISAQIMISLACSVVCAARHSFPVFVIDCGLEILGTDTSRRIVAAVRQLLPPNKVVVVAKIK